MDFECHALADHLGQDSGPIAAAVRCDVLTLTEVRAHEDVIAVCMGDQHAAEGRRVNPGQQWSAGFAKKLGMKEDAAHVCQDGAAPLDTQRVPDPAVRAVGSDQVPGPDLGVGYLWTGRVNGDLRPVDVDILK